jgi:hypothetical protein
MQCRYNGSMTDVVRPVQTASAAVVGHHGAATPYVSARNTSSAFHHVVKAALTKAHAPKLATHTAAQHAANAIPYTRRAENPLSIIPPQSDAALQQAMKLEGVPQSWQSGLRFIMAQESGGQVGAKNPVHSARGLFQLTAANAHLNPNGARSFGNAVEEAQGGIRYIQQRYGTPDNAVAFWQQHHWY